MPPVRQSLQWGLVRLIGFFWALSFASGGSAQAPDDKRALVMIYDRGDPDHCNRYGLWHEAAIEIRSEAGKGTSVTIIIPDLSGEAVPQQVKM